MSIVTDIQLVINDIGVFWPLPQILDAVNESQFAIYAETKWAITSATMLLGSNVDIVSIPQSILIPRWIEGTNTNFVPAVVKRFFPTSMRNLEHFLRTWRGDNLGQPVYFVLWDSTHWRCFPRPDGSGSGPNGNYMFTVFGIGLPAEITTSSQSLLGPQTYYLAVQNYAVSLLLEATRPDLADLYMAQAVEQILNFKKRLRNQQSHNIRTLKPATSQLEISQAGQVNELPSYYPLEA
jgi:hypothetical protein